MKDIYRHPTFYYILVPAVVAMWPLLVWAVYLPRAEESWNNDQEQYLKAEKTITEILDLDPTRLDVRATSENGAEFDYTTSVDEVARLCKIALGKYTLASRPAKESKSKKSKTQDCTVILREVDIATFAKFFSALQHRWPNLKCERMVLTKSRGLPDAWKVVLDFKYYF